MWGSCQEARTELRGLGKAPFRDPPAWTCLDLSHQGLWDSQRDEQLGNEVNKWELSPGQILVPACGVRLRVQPCPLVLTAPFSRCPRLALLCVGVPVRTEVGLRKGPPIRPVLALG